MARQADDRRGLLAAESHRPNETTVLVAVTTYSPSSERIGMSSTTRLPADFTSLYRLFLRATGASVLNKAYPTQRLRRLWRPSFDSAAQVTHRLQGESLEEGERTCLQRWYSVWETRSM